jgi:hypothetical protein
MRNKAIVALALVVAWSGAVVAVTAGSSGSALAGSMGVAVLRAPAEVGQPNESGGFAMVFNQQQRTLVFWLHFGHLSSTVTSAGIYAGSAPGAALVTLCSPCKTSLVKYSVHLTSRQVALLAKNLRIQDSQGFSQLAVSVNTAENPNGEVQGAIPYLCNPCPSPPPKFCKPSRNGCGLAS